MAVRVLECEEPISLWMRTNDSITRAGRCGGEGERKGECLLWMDGRAREVLIYQGTQGLRDSYNGTHPSIVWFDTLSDPWSNRIGLHTPADGRIRIPESPNPSTFSPASPSIIWYWAAALRFCIQQGVSLSELREIKDNRLESSDSNAVPVTSSFQAKHATAHPACQESTIHYNQIMNYIPPRPHYRPFSTLLFPFVLTRSGIYRIVARHCVKLVSMTYVVHRKQAARCVVMITESCVERAPLLF